MSDELMIQPQVQRTSPMPYVLGGAAIGGGAGYLAANAVKGKAKSYEELVKDANEKDKVELTSKKEAVDKAQKALDDASKAVYDGPEKKALDDAIAARDKELARLTETKEGSAKLFEAKDWDKLKIKSNELPTTNERTGKAFTTDKGAAKWESEVKAEYNRLKADYDKAVRNFGVADEKKLNNAKIDIQKYMDNMFSTYEKTKPVKLDALFSAETDWFGNHTAPYQRAKRTANIIIPRISGPSALTDKQYLEFAERLEKGAATPAGHTTKTVHEVVDGKRVAVRVAYTKDMVKDFIKSENEKIAEKQNELTESMLTRAREYVDLQKQSKNFDANFIETVTDDTANKTGLFKVNGSRKEVKIDSIVAEAGGSASKSGAPSFYDKDIRKLQQAIEKHGGSDTAHIPTSLKGTYTRGIDLATMLEQAETRKSVLKDYNAEKRSLNSSIRECIEDHAKINELKTKINEARNSNEAIAKAKEALLKQFPQLDNGEGVAREGLSEEAAKAKDSYKKLARIVEEKQKAYDKVAGEKGKVNEAAKKNAEDALTKAKGELEKFVADANKNIKGLKGGAKAAVIGGAALVGAIIGNGIVNSKNRKAEEAFERQIIA